MLTADNLLVMRGSSLCRGAFRFAAVVCLLLGCRANLPLPQAMVDPPKRTLVIGDPSDQPSGPQYVPGELILKLKPEVGEQLDEALGANRAPIETGLAWLDVLNERYGVTKIEPLFAHRPDIEAIKRKYPERTRRAPPDAKIPSLAHIYKLTMRQEADVLQAATDYSAQPAVEYAEPNYLATIQQSPRDLP